MLRQTFSFMDTIIHNKCNFEEKKMFHFITIANSIRHLRIIDVNRSLARLFFIKLNVLQFCLSIFIREINFVSMVQTK